MIYSTSRMSPFRFVAISLTAVFVAVFAAGAVRGAETFEWLPAEAQGAELSAEAMGGERIIPTVTLTKTPRPTADLAGYTKVYTIDPAKFGIRNDGTEAEATSKGLNAALQEAKQAGANRIVFPEGTFLLHETMPLVIDHKNTVIDLNRSTLMIRPNGLPKYALVEFVQGAENVRLTNGTLRGDRDTHDYKADKSTHEWGAGIRFFSGAGLEVDHITAYDMTGDGVVSELSGARNRPELLERIKHSIYLKQLESGGLTEVGVKVDDKTKTRTAKPLEMSGPEREFEIGYMAGYMGYPFIKGRVYQAYFYDAEMKFLERKKCLQYRKVELPTAARWMHLEFNQAEVSDVPAHAGAAKGEWVVRVTNFKPSTDVHFHDNVLMKNRRLGMAYCGGQRWLIENNRFDENGGTAPAYGVDFEDGSELMQDVVFRRNKFHGNRGGDLVVCAGSELIFEDNVFEKNVVTWGRLHNYTFRNNHYTGGSVIYTTRTGVASIHGNRYDNCKLSISFDTKGVADGLVRRAGHSVATPPLRLEDETLVDVADVTGTYFDFAKCKISNSKFTAGKETRLVRLRDCKIDESSLRFEADGPPVAVTTEATTGALVESGPGLSRKTAAPQPAR